MERFTRKLYLKNTLGDLNPSYRGVNSIISDKDGYVSGF